MFRARLNEDSDGMDCGSEEGNGKAMASTVVDQGAYSFSRHFVARLLMYSSRSLQAEQMKATCGAAGSGARRAEIASKYIFYKSPACLGSFTM